MDRSSSLKATEGKGETNKVFFFGSICPYNPEVNKVSTYFRAAAPVWDEVEWGDLLSLCLYVRIYVHPSS